jgi:hypothetical protein
MKGIDPDGTDKERAADEAAWFKAHPVITAEEREKMRVQGEKNQGVLALHRASKKAFPPCPEGVPGKKGIQTPLSPGYPLETR